MDNRIRESEQDKTALREFLAEVDKTYPRGWYVAIGGGKVLAASADFHELEEMLVAQGRNPPNTVVVEAGARRPEYVTIL